MMTETTSGESARCERAISGAGEAMPGPSVDPARVGMSPVGVIGAGVMGASLARNLARNLNRPVVIFDIDRSKVGSLIVSHPNAGLVGTSDLGAFVGALDRPQVVLLMVPAGQPVDASLEALCPLLGNSAVVIDAGNSHFTDTERRVAYAHERGVSFFGMGVSGGEQGALWGPSLMAGGDPEVWDVVRPLLEPIAAKADDGQSCVALVGSGASGHFAKMVHNGIEYADIQLIAEACAALRATGLSVLEVAAEFRQWNQGRERSYLLESTIEVLSTPDPIHHDALVDHVLDRAKGKGTGAWTVMAAADVGVSVDVIAASLFARSASSAVRERDAWLAREAGEDGARWEPDLLQERDLRRETGQLDSRPIDVSPEVIREAYFAARLIAYQQGMSLLAAASREHGWGVHLARLNRIWRAGCIIRSGFLDDVAAIYDADRDCPSFAAVEPFGTELAERLGSLRVLVAATTLAALPTPALAAALNHQTMLRSRRLSTSLVQLLRDYFGAHTFERTDMEGHFHVVWGGDRELRCLHAKGESGICSK